MRKSVITTLAIIYTIIAKSQIPQEFKPPFQYGKYVHYDKEVRDVSTTQPYVTYANEFGYRENQTTYNNYAKINYYIKYRRKDCSSDHNKLQKPFVFVEGVSFDKESIREGSYTLKEYYEENINSDPNKPNTQVLTDALNYINSVTWGNNENPTVGYSTFNWATLVTGIDAEGLSVGEPLDVQKCPELLNKLYNNGYDIIFVDFHSGQNYMENNGYTLSKVLKDIKDSLDYNGSSEKIVVCGASMGGLVSRFAIRDLELNGGSNYDHCVGKFIGFDSPQMGANINLALQYLLQDLTYLKDAPYLQDVDLLKDKFNAYRKLTCPSASQLVLYSCLPDPLNSNPIKLSTASPSAERISFNSHANIATWPTNCKKYSIINGSRLGYSQNSGTYNDCNLIVDVDGAFNINFKSLPKDNDGYCNIFNLGVANSLYILPIVNPLALTTAQFSIELTQLTKSVRVKNSKAIDMVAGCYRTDLKLLGTLNSKMNTLLGVLFGTTNSLISSLNSSITNPPNFCFIPAMSSAGIIDFTNKVENSNTELPNLFNGSHKLVDPTHQKTYFDVVYAPEQNQTHVEITDENINWVMQILNGCDDEIIKFKNETVQSGTYTACNSIYSASDFGIPTTEFTTTYATTSQSSNNLDIPPPTPIGGSVSLYSVTGEFYNGDLVNTWEILTPVDNRGPVTIQNGSNVTFQAGSLIDIKEVFEVEAGAIFDAKILNGDGIACSGSGRFANPESSEPIASTSNIGYVKRNNATLFKRQSTTDDIDVILEKSDADKLVLIPNPATSTCNLFYNVENASEVIIEISTLYGQVLTRNNSSSQQNEGNHSVTLDVSKLTKGVYMVQIKTKDINRCTKLIVE